MAGSAFDDEDLNKILNTPAKNLGSLDLDSALSNLTRDPGLNRPGSMQIIRTTAGVSETDRNDPKAMLSVFEQAFPDDIFESFITEQGQSGVRTVGKKQRKYEPVPEGYNAQIASRGIADVKTALEKATTDEERVKLAIQLNQMVTVQKAHNFNSYKSAAETEFGIPALLQAIEGVRQAEARSPFNPGNGMPSAQRLELINHLGIARQRAASRVAELMGADPAIVEAESLAKSTLATIDAVMKLDERKDRNEDRDARRSARRAAIDSIDQAFVDNVGILKLGKTPDEKVSLSIREQLVDGKIKLSDTERLLVTASDETLTNFYAQTKNEKEKASILSILGAKERKTAGDEATAKRNVEIFRKVMSIDLSDEKNTMVTPALRKKWKQANQEVIAQAAASGRAKDELLGQRAVALKRELLDDVIRQAMYGNVRTWQGVIQSDDLAKHILNDPKNKDKNISLQEFIGQYAAVSNGKNWLEKSKSIQAIAASALSAMPKSAILPIPSEESLMLEVQRMSVGALTRNSYDGLRNLLPGGLTTNLLTTAVKGIGQ